MEEEQLRFFLDEHIPIAVLPALRRFKIDVTAVDELRLKGTDDEELAPLARRQRRVFVTMDADFLAMAKAGMEHSGIVFVDGDLTAGPIARALKFIHATTTAEQIQNQIEFASNFTDV
jgi:predicted nuclease of predicted toxin-antitoxin system